MPTLIRLVVWLVLIVAIAYAAMFALANFVKPSQRELHIELPAIRPNR
jgi:hypothetical protein